MPLYQWVVDDELTIRFDLPRDVAETFNRLVDLKDPNDPESSVSVYDLKVYGILMEAVTGLVRLNGAAHLKKLMPEKITEVALEASNDHRNS